jgi:hypothetical protein
MIPEKLRKLAVVAINEYPARGPLPVGHVNITFFWRGRDEGTFGYNSQGVDIAGHHHMQSLVSDNMHGGVFVETERNALIHYVVVSDENYRRMRAFAYGEAVITSGRNNLRYIFSQHNCADFLYQVFEHSDLSPNQRNIYHYLKDPYEPVAIYAGMRSSHYLRERISDPQNILTPAK